MAAAILVGAFWLFVFWLAGNDSNSRGPGPAVSVMVTGFFMAAAWWGPEQWRNDGE